ncbi:hypothetical protein GCK72_003514 [Caenorhabditis remanei]|uniref:PAN-3 domain-containing protein n=1 Tax=Caenorhabditis remanei TaxID=31234 RepID=A0A6A5HYB7_CAERE|nr:hypothetical protein GCK72_003514 [Caenorhabditis remanei]KAF1771687.1 hypothetical protein GCK72_003514 [Caenorhabditis remanei]
MIVMNGTPVNTTGTFRKMMLWEDCISECYFDDDCLCGYFKWGNITIMKEFSFLVAFKVDKLHNSSTAIPSISTEWSNGTHIFQKAISSESATWNLVNLITKCPVNSTIYIRTSKIVCVGIRIFEDLEPGNYTRAQALCKGNGGYSITGPNLASTALAPLTPIATNKNSLWVDGYCNATGEYTFDDDSHEGSGGYQFFDGEPNDGATAALMLYKSNQLGDVGFDSTTSSGYAFRGAYCRLNDVLVDEIEAILKFRYE